METAKCDEDAESLCDCRCVQINASNMSTISQDVHKTAFTLLSHHKRCIGHVEALRQHDFQHQIQCRVSAYNGGSGSIQILVHQICDEVQSRTESEGN